MSKVDRQRRYVNWEEAERREDARAARERREELEQRRERDALREEREGRMEQ